MSDPDVYAWDLLSMILGSGETSRLYHVVKDQKGLVDSVYASSYTPKDPGLLFIGGVMSPDKTNDALREILLETFKTVAAPPEGPELSRAKTSTETDFVYSLESVSALARLVGFYETTLNDAAFEQTYLRKIRAVTAEDILAVAKKYLSPENLTVSMVLPTGQPAVEDPETIRKIAKEAFETATAPAKEKEEKAAVVKEVLPNGIRVIVREDHAVPVVAVEAGFLAGLRAEPADKGGVAGLTAGMLTKGTKNRSAREISEAVENMGAELSGYSGRNTFGLQGKFLRRDFQQGFRLFTESLREPTFPAEELEKKRREALGALKQQKDQLTQAAFLLFLETHYDGHPYARNPLGTEQSLREMTPGDLKDYYQRWADPRNMVIAISGDIEAQEALEAVRKAFGDFPKRAGFKPLGALPVPSLERDPQGGGAAGDAAGPFRHRLPRGPLHRPGPLRPRRPRLGPRGDGGTPVRRPPGPDVARVLRDLLLLRAGGSGLLRLLHGYERGQARYRDRRHVEGDRGSEGGRHKEGRARPGEEVDDRHLRDRAAEQLVVCRENGI